MSASSLTITTGPGRGATFEFDEELINIGRGEMNQVVIDDADLEEHHASIVCRNGRYAIYTAIADAVEVDTNMIPAERWVWLPEQSTIRLGGRTTCIFSYEAGEQEAGFKTATIPPPKADAESSADDNPPPPPKPPEPSKSSSKKSKAKKSSKSKRSSKRSASKKSGSKKESEVARFVTNKSGEALVQFGADGEMPQLQLDEGVAKKAQESNDKQSNPLILYGALSLSFLASLSMIFLDLEPVESEARQKARIRREIVKYYGGDEEKEELKEFQRHLREARLAFSRNDRDGEAAAYRKVLAMLNAEDNNPFNGLTGKGSVADEELKSWLGILLSK